MFNYNIITMSCKVFQIKSESDHGSSVVVSIGNINACGSCMHELEWCVLGINIKSNVIDYKRIT